jgi:hypothetical protein
MRRLCDRSCYITNTSSAKKLSQVQAKLTVLLFWKGLMNVIEIFSKFVMVRIPIFGKAHAFGAYPFLSSTFLFTTLCNGKMFC